MRLVTLFRLLLVLSLLAVPSAAAAQGPALAAAVLPAPVASTAIWDGTFGLPGVYGRVQAIARNGNDLYVGGRFSKAGGIEANGIARWDGVRWHALGQGLKRGGRSAGYVNAIAVIGSDVYAAGLFDTAGSINANNIARWDGSAWHAVGDGADGEVYALAVIGDELYAGGRFTEVSNAPGSPIAASGLACWDGSAWRPVGGGVEHWDSAGEVYALAVSGATLYVGGRFDQAGSISANHVARWDGSAWAALGSGVGGHALSAVRALAVDGNDVYAGGTFTSAGSTPAGNIARWDGSHWSALGNGVGGPDSTEPVRALLVQGGVVYAGGGLTVAGGAGARFLARWDGAEWAEFGGGLPESVYGAYVLASDGAGGLYVGGDAERIGDRAANNIAYWDGSAWQALGQGVSGGTAGGQIRAVAVAADGDVYVGGEFEYAGGVPARNVARWDGTRWHPLGRGVDGAVYALALEGTSLYVGGSFSRAGGLSAARIARWDTAGHTWRTLGSGVAGPSVNAIAVDGSMVYVGGSFDAAGGVDSPNLARWDGAHWSAFPGDTEIEGPVYALAVADDAVVVGGAFSTVRRQGIQHEVNGILLFRSSGDWSALGQGDRAGVTDSWGQGAKVYALAIGSGGVVYAAGDFEQAGPVSAAGIARWSAGSGWAPLGNGLGAQAGSRVEGWALAASGPSLYIGGRFTQAGGGNAAFIARWDMKASTWSALGAGMDGIVYALALGAGGSLYAGGRFTQAGGAGAQSFCRWGEPRSSLVAQWVAYVPISLKDHIPAAPPTVSPTPTATPGVSPTATATPQAQPTATATPTVTPTNPALTDVHGRVTYRGQPAAGITLQLRFWNGSAWSTRATALTQADGTYRFTGVPRLAADQAYYVRYENGLYGNSSDDRYLAGWLSFEIIGPTTGSSALAGGDFDIADIELLAPEPYAVLGFPIAFRWTPRTATPDDSYTLVLFEEDLTVKPWARTAGATSSLTLYDVPHGYATGKEYGWYVVADAPDGGQGASYWYHPITFAGAGSATARRASGKPQKLPAPRLPDWR